MSQKPKKSNPYCQESVTKIKHATLANDIIEDMAAIFRALGDPTRIRLIHTLIQSEMCVCDLAKVLEMSQSAVSHQLRNLKNLRIVKWRKAGRSVYYSIDDDHVVTLFNNGLDHMMHR